MNVVTVPMTEMIVPIPEMILPPTKRTGPIAATIPAIVTICFLVSSSIAMNISITPWIFSITGVRYSAMMLPRDVTRTSRLDFNFSMDPPNPLIMASAISCVVPVLFLIDSLRASTSEGAVLIRASQEDIWFLPKIAPAAAICSCSLSLAKAS